MSIYLTEHQFIITLKRDEPDSPIVSQHTYSWLYDLAMQGMLMQHVKLEYRDRLGCDYPLATIDYGKEEFRMSLQGVVRSVEWKRAKVALEECHQSGDMGVNIFGVVCIG